jgi:2-C-methyl-D-erythritol 4-phosphate cytidylyltransferase
MARDVSVVVLAAGQGRRMGGTNKALMPLAGQSVLAHCMQTFTASPSVAEIIVVMNSDDVAGLRMRWQTTPLQLGAHKVVPGGVERWLSSRTGCLATSNEASIVLVHDCARALVEVQTIEAVAQAARDHQAALAAEPLADTLKKEGVGGKVVATVPRENLWRAQTPQGFDRSLLLQAFEHWQATQTELPTDEAMLLEHLGHAPMLVPAPASNFKLTTPSDVDLAESLLAKRR